MHDPDSGKMKSNRTSQDFLMDESSRQDSQCPPKYRMLSHKCYNFKLGDHNWTMVRLGVFRFYTANINV